MNNSLAEPQAPGKNHQRVDWNSLFLLLFLTVPAGVMVVLLFLWPDVLWVAEIPYSVIEILGSFTAILLAIFIIARYLKQSGVLYISAGLIAMGIIGGFRAISPPGSNESVWLHSLAGISGGVFFAYYVLAEVKKRPIPSIRTTVKGMVWLLGSVTTVAFLSGALLVVFSGALPNMVQGGNFTPLAWMLNAVPVVLFLFAGAKLFWQYRQTGAGEIFLFTVILIFLFQASEVFYFATLWGVIWWLWLGLRLIIYLVVLGYVLKEYLQMSHSLAAESDERKKVEGALRKADEDWRDSFNALEETMLIVDRGYTIENINNSGLSLLGRGKGEVIGEKCYRVFHGDDEPSQYCPLRRTFKTGKVVSIERHDELFDKHLSIKSAPIFNENGRVVKCVYLMTDITGRVKAEEKEGILKQELNLTSRLASIGEVAAGITHEINNPLTSVIAFAQMLKQMDVPENIEEAVEVINEGANRIAGIVEKLLTFARQQRPEKEYVDINAIVTSTVEMHSYELRNNNIEVITQLAADLPRTMANVGQLQQVFLNIILNAEQAMAGTNGRGKLSIETERIDGRIRVSIADDGPGIARDNIDKLFDPFFTTKEADGGTGLGLSISYGIINEHEGKIYAQSTLGKGATFIVDLPIGAETRLTKTVKASGAEPRKVIGARIMVVDDEPNICRALDRLLTRERYKVETMSSAERALLRLKKASYDLVLLDIKMPGINGIEFYDRMGEIKPLLQQKVICITGDVISARNKAFLDKTGIPCLVKPFGVDELIQKVKLVLGGKTENA